MLQEEMPHDRALTAAEPPTALTDVTEKTLLFDPGTGMFGLGSPTAIPNQPITDPFRIPLSVVPQTITINTGPGIEFMPLMPFKPLLLNNSGSFGNISKPLSNPTRIEIPVTELPSAGSIFGFVLFLQFTSGSTTVKIIETPPFLITTGQLSVESDLTLDYDSSDGTFRFTENSTNLPGALTLEKGLILLRLKDDSSSPPPSIIRVSLTSDKPGVVFADNPIISTLPSPLPVTNVSDTEITITRAFNPGTGFGLSFGVKIPLGANQMCTVYSPDPIIVDKQIGTGGGGEFLYPGDDPAARRPNSSRKPGSARRGSNHGRSK